MVTVAKSPVLHHSSMTMMVWHHQSRMRDLHVYNTVEVLGNIKEDDGYDDDCYGDYRYDVKKQSYFVYV